MTNLDTGQRRVERLADTLLAFVPGHFGLGRTFFFLRRLPGRRHGFGLIEEYLLDLQRRMPPLDPSIDFVFKSAA